MEKSPDAFRTISEVADHLETPAHVLRFWESRFPQIKPVKRAGGRRYYRPSDVALLSGIKRLLHDEGMTIRGVQKMLREQGVRQVAAFGTDTAALEEVFAVDERLLEGIPGVGPEPPSAEILSFQSHHRTGDEVVSVTDPSLRDGSALDGGPDPELPRPVLPPLPVTALEVQDEDETTLSQAIGPMSPPGEPAASEGDRMAEDMSADEEAPFVDTEAEPGWHQDAPPAELHRLHGATDAAEGPGAQPDEPPDEGFFAGPEADWEPEEEAGAEFGAEPEDDVPSVEAIADLAALDGVGIQALDPGQPADGTLADGTLADGALAGGTLAGGAESAEAAETEALPGDNVFLDAGVLEAWAEPAEVPAAAGADSSDAPATEAQPAVPAPQGDLWSAAGLAAPPAVPPRSRGAELLADEPDDLLDVDLPPILPVLTRLRSVTPESMAEHGTELAALHGRLLALREAMAAAARVRAR